MVALSPGLIDQEGRVHALVGAHRHTQAEHRAALAAESRRGLAAAEHRATVVLEALRRCGALAVADQLAQEAQAGSGLIVALTSDDTTPAELAAAIHAYTQRQVAVEQALEQHAR
jgi:hypothetical protein